MTRLVHRIAERDRALLHRLAIDDHSALIARFWRIVTHLGGATMSVVAATIPLFMPGTLRDAGVRTALILAISHVVVQLVKRSVERPRPTGIVPAIDAPDRYSFPSGHAAAVLSVAIGYATTYPSLAAPLVAVAGAVGVSRVMLGVHFPADVVAGQMITLATAAAVIPLFQRL